MQISNSNSYNIDRKYNLKSSFREFKKFKGQLLVRRILLSSENYFNKESHLSRIFLATTAAVESCTQVLECFHLKRSSPGHLRQLQILKSVRVKNSSAVERTRTYDMTTVKHLKQDAVGQKLSTVGQ